MRMLVLILVAASTVLSTAHADNLKPYTLAATSPGEMEAVRTQVEKGLAAKGFSIAGRYAPMQDETLAVLCISHPLLRKHAGEAGELLGFAAALRVGLRKTDKGVEVAYTTPAYWGNAYYRKGYPNVEDDYDALAQSLEEALGTRGGAAPVAFGSKKGLSEKKLRKYHYMVSMPHFDDVVVLQDELAYTNAVERIEARAPESADAEIVYVIKFPEKKMALFGISLTGEKGEKKFLPKIDFGEPRHTPFLPYEMLVLEDRTVMLHGKYRIALSFPDLSMGTFMKIVSTPGNIADAMRSLVEDAE